MQTRVQVVLALVLAIDWPLGEPFLAQRPTFTTRWGGVRCQEISGFATAPPPRSRCRATISTKEALSAARRPANIGTEESASNGENIDHVVTQERVIAAAAKKATSEDRDTEAAAERLHREVFANEKGFLESQEFNPRRAREKEEEEEVKRMAAQWGSTPEKAKEVLEKTKRSEELSFQELETIARDLNLADDQQRAFMMKASMTKLADATTLPRRTSKDPVKEALRERVFAEETGFLQNSEEFKNKLKAGSGVHFDHQGFPVLDEGDPAIQAVNIFKGGSGVQNATLDLEGVVFPSLPDCPRCSAPTTEDELSKFGMCSQCKALEVSATTYSGPSAPSKYTYDNGEAPFSDSWRPRRGKDGRRSDRSTVEPEGSPPLGGKGTSASAEASIPQAAGLGRGMMDRRTPKHGVGPDKASLQPSSTWPTFQASETPAVAATGAAAVTSTSGRTSGASAVTPSSSDRTPPSPGPDPAPAAGGNRGAGTADQRAFARSRRDSRGISGTQPSGEDNMWRLAGEVAKLRSKLAEVSAAMEGIGGPEMGGGKVARQEGRDAAVRKLSREVAELRSAFEAKGISSSSSSSSAGDAAMRKLSREVTKLRSDLAQARKEQSLTQLALRRLREQVESLASRDSSR